MANLFQECHSILEPTLPTDIASCKSRSIECHSYYLGNGEPNNAFVCVSLKVMPGRSIDTLKNAGDKIMLALKNYFASSLEKLNLQITLEIIELQKTYFKITSGT
jgi:5-carboxymethyl-2-hydroxymuconate isomerase